MKTHTVFSRVRIPAILLSLHPDPEKYKAEEQKCHMRAMEEFAGYEGRKVQAWRFTPWGERGRPGKPAHRWECVIFGDC